MRDTNLVNALREHAEWAQANEWETPISLGDDLAEAADRIEAQAKEIEKLRAQLPRWIPVEERLPELQNWGASTVVLGLIKSKNAPSLNKLYDLTLCVYCDLDRLEKLPAADVAPVVRCEDCKYRIYKHVNDYIGEIGGCSIFNHPMPNDAFCSYGERKDGGADHDA